MKGFYQFLPFRVGIIIGCLLLVSGKVSASEVGSLEASIEKIEGTDNIVVDFKNRPEQIVSISIKNRTGQNVVSEKVKNAEKWKKIYDLHRLPKGDYTIEVTDGTEVVRKTVKVINSNVLHPEIGKVFVAGISKVANDKSAYVIVKNTTGKKLWVKVIDREGLPVVRKIVNAGDFNKVRLDLSALESGSYTIKVISDDIIYSKSVYLKS